MRNLVFACFKKYLASAEFKIGSVISLAAGVICGLIFKNSASSAALAAVAPAAISVAAAVINIAKEWEFRTFANKLIIGHTKVKIFFSELIAALSAGAAIYALFGAGFAAASPKIIFGPNLPAILRISALMALAGLSLCAISSAISFVCKTHNSALVISFAAIFILFFLSEPLSEFVYSNEIQSRIYESYYSGLAADSASGGYIDPATGIELAAADYVPTRVIKLAKAAYAVNPIGALDLYANELLPYLEGGRPDPWSRYPRALPLCSFGLIAAAAGFGAAVFHKKDVK